MMTSADVDNQQRGLARPTSTRAPNVASGSRTAAPRDKPSGMTRGDLYTLTQAAEHCQTTVHVIR
jgi:hypothetical protein